MLHLIGVFTTMAASLFAAAVLVAAASAAIRIPTGTNELFSYAQPALGLRHCDFQAFATQQDLGLAVSVLVDQLAGGESSPSVMFCAFDPYRYTRFEPEADSRVRNRYWD